MFDNVPEAGWLLVCVAFSGMLLLIGVRFYRRGFKLKWGRNKELDCETDVVRKEPDRSNTPAGPRKRKSRK